MFRGPCTVLALLLIAGLSAGALPLSADEVHLGANTSQTGSASLLHVAGQGTNAGLDGLDLRGANLEIWVWEDQGVRGAREPVTGNDAYLVYTTRAGGSSDPDVTTLKDATGSLDAASTDFIANLWSNQEFDLESESRGLQVSSIDDPVLRREGIYPDDAATKRSGGGSFASIPLDGTHLLSRVEPDGARLVVEGDFVLELHGVDLKIDGDLYQSRDETGNITGEGSVDDQMHTITERFVRIFVTAGKATFTVGSDHTDVAWVQEQASAAAADAELLRPVGEYQGRALSGTMALLEGPMTLDMRALDEQVGLDATPDGATAATTVAPVPAGVGLVLLFGFLTIVSLTITIMLAVRAWRSLPSMDEVEAALEGGAYRRAALLAGKIVRRRPQMHDAMLSRAIALSRMGRPRQVVREVGSYVQHQHTDDGTLHYVLGLAYKDLGDPRRAQKFLSQAASQTPDLQGPVRQHIDLPQAAPPGGDAYA